MLSWTDEQIAVLRELWGKESASKIAKKIGGSASRNAVIGKAHRLGLVKRGRVAKVRGDTLLAPPRKRVLAAKPPKPPRATRISAITGLPMRNLPAAHLPREPAPPPRPDQDIPRKALIDLEAGDCRWPVTIAEGTPAERHMFCGDKQVPGSSYCACHLQRATNAWQPRHESDGHSLLHINARANIAAKIDAVRFEDFEEFVTS